MSQTDNRIDYVEFAAEDLVGAKAFYAAAFGWTFQDWGPDYVSFEGAGVDGGIRGGEITERHEFPGGRRFHFRDPAGNVLGVWTKAEGED